MKVGGLYPKARETQGINNLLPLRGTKLTFPIRLSSYFTADQINPSESTVNDIKCREIAICIDGRSCRGRNKTPFSKAIGESIVPLQPHSCLTPISQQRIVHPTLQ
jgi:hypothetical protein